ncbi:MAG: Fe-S cluster assembly ATPase SufC [Bacilli bacterium]|jgi:Fe-S cluster assembly ATP-binding protein|nr:Fe-S cluster assembly ATPase SufC [Bacilli bacterium]MDD2681746.1 Fe-S cluster assembly ATPase SufC [Bacilli bacterium]MDD3121006.1 Fe-S cluster assembly ATPase SufC [Bacilli bacterium]MDD4063180.1 Fe-S cluster assembly ATPase SufC [Bacilli bacterium]MDD4481820.1 Fe-S cluster assembly ATPase SufC [Bacilli bacterium]
MSRVLKIENLHVNVDGVEILKGINLEINTGEFHAIMGPNGSGKSTLASTIMGHYKYEVTQGKILLDGLNVLEMSVDERSRNGLFLAMQYPNEVSGITNSEFIKTAMQARLPEGKHVSLYKFITELELSVKDLKMNSDLPHRYLNEGFSGGERKRNEILQLKMLKPSFAILDEIDSGLDVDALKIVGENVSKLRSPNFGGLIITHYERLLDYIKCDYVHVIVDGKIIKTGGQELIEKIDTEGYDWVKTELGIFEEGKKKKARVVLGTCAVKEAISKEVKVK